MRFVAKTAKYLLLAFVALSSILGTSAIAYYVLTIERPFRGLRFEITAWNATNPMAPGACDRVKMVHDVLKQIPPGTPRQKVKSLLGSPDERQGRAEYYYLGQCHPFEPNAAAYLMIHYDAEGRLLTANQQWGEVKEVQPNPALLTFTETAQKLDDLWPKYEEQYRAFTSDQLRVLHTKLKKEFMAISNAATLERANEEKRAELDVQISVIESLLLNRWESEDTARYLEMSQEDLEKELSRLQKNLAKRQQTVLDPRDIESQRIETQINIVDQYLAMYKRKELERKMLELEVDKLKELESQRIDAHIDAVEQYMQKRKH